MPRKGYRCITVTEQVHQDIQKRANETNRTMKQYIEYLLENQKTHKEA